jgi:hypothetical protein
MFLGVVNVKDEKNGRVVLDSALTYHSIEKAV